MATSIRGYTSVRPDAAATLAQTLRLNGYNTAAFGKMHQTPTWETSQSGPFDRWPTGEGFERFYGFVGGENNQWVPSLFEGTTPVRPPRTPAEGYHLSEDLADKTIDYVRQQQVMTPDKPFFAYLSFGATHAPHHVPKSWIDKYKGTFDQGWDKLREETLAGQKKLGVVPEDCKLTERHQEIPAWDTLSPDQKKVSARLMETYAAFAEHTDVQVGRVIDALQAMGILDDTIVLYILGDNGASGEGGIDGAFNVIAALNGIPDVNVRGQKPLTPGRHTVRHVFGYDGGGGGKGRSATLFVDDVEVGKARIEKTVPFMFSSDDMMDVGRDESSPVTEDYGVLDGVFGGSIDWVRIDLGTERNEEPAGVERVAMARQ